MPHTMGRIVTAVSWPSVFQKGNCTAALPPMNHSIDQPTIHGMVKTHTMLEIAVRVTESAVSPLDKWVITFEVAPPGQAARTISPTASSPGSRKSSAKAKAMTGSMTSWQVSPTSFAFGCRKTRRKSSGTRLSPMPKSTAKSATGRATCLRTSPDIGSKVTDSSRRVDDGAA